MKIEGVWKQVFDNKPNSTPYTSQNSVFYLGFLVWGGKLRGVLAPNREGESGGILPWKIYIARDAI